MSQEIKTTVQNPAKLNHLGVTTFRVEIPGLRDLKHGEQIIVTIQEGA